MDRVRRRLALSLVSLAKRLYPGTLYVMEPGKGFHTGGIVKDPGALRLPGPEQVMDLHTGKQGYTGFSLRDR